MRLVRECKPHTLKIQVQFLCFYMANTKCQYGGPVLIVGTDAVPRPLNISDWFLQNTEQENYPGNTAGKRDKIQSISQICTGEGNVHKRFPKGRVMF